MQKNFLIGSIDDELFDGRIRGRLPRVRALKGKFICSVRVQDGNLLVRVDHSACHEFWLELVITKDALANVSKNA